MLVSARWAPDGTLSYAVNPDLLAHKLGALASVYVEGAVNFGQSVGLKDILEHEFGFGSSFLAWGGAVRVYILGDCITSHPLRHRYWAPALNATEQELVAEIQHRCFQLACKELRGHAMAPLTGPEEIKVFATRDQLIRLEEDRVSKAPQQASDAEGAEWKSLAEQYASENDTLKAELRKRSEELEELRGQAEQSAHERAELLAINLEQQREIAELRRKISEGRANFDPARLENGQQVYDAAMANFGDRLAFTERGAQTLREFVPNKKGIYSELYAGLEDLYSKLWPLQFPHRDGNFLAEFNNSSQYSLVMTEGPHTKERADLARLRQDTFEGQPIEAWAHLRFGARPGEQFRLHFSFLGEGQSGKIVVSWVGDHMPVASSSKTGKRRG